MEASSSEFCAKVIEIYAKLGLKIDIAKTICSDNKFTYLNRLVVGDSEISTPLRTVGKIVRENSGGIYTVHTQINSVFGSGRAALIKGACSI